MPPDTDREFTNLEKFIQKKPMKAVSQNNREYCKGISDLKHHSKLKLKRYSVAVHVHIDVAGLIT